MNYNKTLPTNLSIDSSFKSSSPLQLSSQKSETKLVFKAGAIDLINSQIGTDIDHYLVIGKGVKMNGEPTFHKWILQPKNGNGEYKVASFIVPIRINNSTSTEFELFDSISRISLETIQKILKCNFIRPTDDSQRDPLETILKPLGIFDSEFPCLRILNTFKNPRLQNLGIGDIHLITFSVHMEPETNHGKAGIRIPYSGISPVLTKENIQVIRKVHDGNLISHSPLKRRRSYF